jgi:rhomboid protease GluP
VTDTPTDTPTTPATRSIPWVAITLAVLNVGVFGWQIAAGADALSPTADWIAAHGGNYAPLTLDGEQWRLFTSMFLHIGLLHLVMNMIGLVDGGRHVEKMYGRAGFIALYLVAGLAGSLASALRGTNVVSAGASGAIFGVFGAFGAFLVLHRGRLDPVQVGKEARGLLIFLAYNVYIGLAVKGVDLLAHFGGLAAGFVCGLALEYGTNEAPSTLKRSLLVGVLGVGLVLGGSLLAPPPATPPNTQSAALFELATTETKILARYKALVADVQKGTLDEEGFASAIELSILPEWRVATANYVRDGRGTNYEELVQYLRARQAAWELTVKATRSKDPELQKQAEEKWKDVEQRIDKLHKLSKQP